MRPKNLGVAYLLDNSLQLYVNGLPEIFSYRFNEESIDQLTIRNEELLENDIANFISEHNIPASSLVIVVADNVASIKKLHADGIEKEQTKAFLDTLPYEHIASKTISTLQGKIIYAVNAELCSVFKTAFEKQGFSIDFVLPAVVFGKDFSNQTILTFEDIAAVLKQAFTKEYYNLIPTKMVPDETELETILKEQTNKDVMRLYAASTIFGALIIALLVGWNNYHPTPSQTYQGRATNNQIIIMPNAQETKDVTVRIIYSQTSSRIELDLIKSLKKYGFKNIVSKQEANHPATIVIFAKNISPTLQAAIITELKSYDKQVTVVNNPTAPFGITIILPN